MIYIPPDQRYSHHAKKAEISLEVVEQAIFHFDPDLQDAQIHELSGGFMNSNFRVSKGPVEFVFRFYSSSRSVAEREHSLLQLLKNRGLRVPQSFGLIEVQGTLVGVIEYFKGVTLQERLLRDPATDTNIFTEIGQELSKIHQIQFENLGFLGPNLVPGREYDNFSVFLKTFIERTLLGLENRPERLSPALVQAISKLVDEKWDLVLQTEPRTQLCHCDFNPKNILVSESSQAELLAVIDWEFGLAGNGLIDLGNFFRFSYDFPSGAVESFVKGYDNPVNQLPAQWIEVSKLLDLANMCSFLERRENYTETFRTAQAVIESTLEFFRS